MSRSAAAREEVSSPAPSREPAVRRRPIDLATEELTRRIERAWPDHVNRWRVSIGGGVLVAFCVYLVGLVALVSGTPAFMLKAILASAILACVVGPVAYHLLCAIVPRRMLYRDIRKWTGELCRNHSLSPVESKSILDARAHARIRELELR